ncbi:hypothetical protein FCM35_KLT06557 [Carex littledalei]|uniref:Uncharacterized protein n=1 Tax=Carex littledalei TaxID=544730 RepID=A0A833R0Y0_9POAL|nr:hypothetical protein FCM35_KLT06557 [Carex littledalei]
MFIQPHQTNTFQPPASFPSQPVPTQQVQSSYHIVSNPILSVQPTTSHVQLANVQIQPTQVINRTASSEVKLTDILIPPPAPISLLPNPISPSSSVILPTPIPAPVPVSVPFPVPLPAPVPPLVPISVPFPVPLPAPVPPLVPSLLPTLAPSPVPLPAPVPATVPAPVPDPVLVLVPDLVPAPLPAPVPVQDHAQPTASKEARHSLRLKAKEGAGKKRRGKSGANSGNPIILSETDTSKVESDTWDSKEDPCLGLEGSDISDFLRDRAKYDAAFFHSSDPTTHASSSSAAS